MIPDEVMARGLKVIVNVPANVIHDNATNTPIGSLLRAGRELCILNGARRL